MAITHVLNISIGFDLTQLLEPQNIPGIKAFLGVKDESKLSEAIFKAKFQEIQKLLSSNDFNIVNAEVNTVASSYTNENTLTELTDKSKKDNDDAKEEIERNTTETESVGVDSNEDKKHFFDALKKEIELINKNDGELTEIKYNQSIIAIAPSPEELHEEANVDDKVIVDVDEEDEDILAIITYVDKKQKIKFKTINDSLIKHKEEISSGK